ncbi:uncharacterized protein TRAVEDRAFT_125335 [Trametes versicolor FP-101664 SS1]|uniref:uncharacterized protein n=1 Tax=Trametes versicolor (strain FP-101664) TaxID=717944 RepID=UPI000462446B|nr:uncharacterized protein TRAVEDRAFT_125335 [Trametes versicolor FP-101664 SS1]EIW57572.1 hypothetical protein TRAVEDRAFT_125335 [Trametes versicolor FP-101664 SS1]
MRPIDLPAPKCFEVVGASLSHLTQRLAYRGIKSWRPSPLKPSTRRALECAQTAIQAATGARPTEGALWGLLKRDPISRKARDFIWKALHGAHRVGDYWKNIPGYETRAVCAHCDVADSLEHILVECAAPGRATAWYLADLLLKNRGFSLRGPSYGLVLGCQALEILNNKGNLDSGATRLAKIVVSETAYLIWTLRCERVIGWALEPRRTHSEQEIEN